MREYPGTEIRRTGVFTGLITLFGRSFCSDLFHFALLSKLKSNNRPTAYDEAALSCARMLLVTPKDLLSER
jgi:hypothetical protein